MMLPGHCFGPGSRQRLPAAICSSFSTAECRPEENACIAAGLKAPGHHDAEYIPLPGCGYAACLDFGGAPLLRFMERIAGKISATAEK